MPQTPATLAHPTRCALGEGPLWANERLFFFDILAKKLHAFSEDNLQSWDMGEHASAAAKTTTNALLIASESSLSLFDTSNGDREILLPLETENTSTRSNDGRSDRQGGFWIGTMGKAAEPKAGALYRFYQGRLHTLLEGITIPNAISFAPDGRTAYFADSAEGVIYRWPLMEDGFPQGTPQPFYSHRGKGAPDGAIVDAQGTLWCAIWEGFKILAIGANGTPEGEIPVPVSRPTCPAAAPDNRTFITTAREGMSAENLAEEPEAGSLFSAPSPAQFPAEPKVAL